MSLSVAWQPAAATPVPQLVQQVQFLQPVPTQLGENYVAWITAESV